MANREPLLFHAGCKRFFPDLREAVAKLIDPTTLCHIASSLFESAEVGTLNRWPELAPQAQPVCTLVGKLVTVDDFTRHPCLVPKENQGFEVEKTHVSSSLVSLKPK